jgi:hypothetical protein
MKTPFLFQEQRTPFVERLKAFDDITISRLLERLWAARNETGRDGKGAESLELEHRHGLLSVLRQDVTRAKWSNLPHEPTVNGIQIEAGGVFDGVTWRLRRNVNNASHGRNGWRVLSFYDDAGAVLHTTTISRNVWDGHNGGVFLIPGYVASLKRKITPVEDEQAGRELEALLDEIYEAATVAEAA